MSGYPTIPTRQAFGPTYLNTRAPDNPETDFGADAMNLLLHQAAGVCLANPAKAALVANWNAGSSAFDTFHQEEAWNPKRDQAHPTLARSAAGVYTYTFASTYNDKDGTAVSTSLVAARVTSHKVLTAYADRIDAYAWIDSGNPLIVQVRLYDAAGAGEDAPFYLEVV